MTAMLTALAVVNEDVADAVATWREAVEARDAAWEDYRMHVDAHNRRVALEGGRRLRRTAQCIRAERRYDQLDHAATWARTEIEGALRVANPTADGRTIMATLREVTR